MRWAVTAWQPLYFFLTEPSASFPSCSQGFSPSPNLTRAGQLGPQCHPSSILLPLGGLYLTKEGLSGVSFAISVLLAGHLLYFKFACQGAEKTGRHTAGDRHGAEMGVPDPRAESVSRSSRKAAEDHQSLLVPSGPWHLCSNILNELSYRKGHQNVLGYYRRVARAFQSPWGNHLATTTTTSCPARAAASPY